MAVNLDQKQPNFPANILPRYLKDLGIPFQEADLIRYAAVKNFPIIPCDLCGSQENLQRKQIKNMLREWEKTHKGRVDNIFAALSTVAPSHLMDRKLFDFAGLKASGQPDPDGDIAFDEAPCAIPTAIPGMIPLHLSE